MDLDIKKIIDQAVNIINPNPKPPLTLKEAAAAVGCSPQTLRRAIWAGELECLRVGREIRIRRADLSAYLRRRVSFPGNKKESVAQ